MRGAQAKQDRSTLRKNFRKAVGEDVAVNVIYLHQFLRRGFWGRMRWLFLGR